MTNKNRSLTPTSAGDDSGSPHPPGAISDPLARLTGSLSDNPTLGELIGFRDSAPDLKRFAVEAKRCDDEAERLWFRLEEGDHVKMARIGLKIIALSCTAMVAIWPTDTIEDADAKRALAKATAMYGDDTDYAFAAMFDVATAERIRLHRAAFAVGELVVPPDPAAPAAADRDLATWPLSRFDLVDKVPLAGGDAVIDGQPLARWAAFAAACPSLSDLVDRFSRMIATADRLTVLGGTGSGDPRPLMRAAEGARILAYLAAAQAAIWPAMLRSADAQAAIRHVVSQANWIAKAFGLGATLELEPAWIPIV